MSKNKAVMKTTEQFKRTIQAYLDERAKNDTLFAVSYAKEGKTIDECCNFILNTVKESGCNGFADEEIYGIAVHYYDEDNLDPKYLKQISGNVVVNHQVTLTEADKAELEEKAKKDWYNECLRKQKEQNKPEAKAKTEVNSGEQQLSLFE